MQSSYMLFNRKGDNALGPRATVELVDFNEVDAPTRIDEADVDEPALSESGLGVAVSDSFEYGNIFWKELAKMDWPAEERPTKSPDT
jgi:hypothetical protein